MSIAGFGASLGDAAQARTDVDAHARPVSVLSLSSRTAQDGAAAVAVREAGFLRVLPTPLDSSFGDASKSTQAEQSPRLQGEGDEQPLAFDAAAPAASLADGRDSASPMLARLHEPAPQPVVGPAIGPVVGDTSGTPAHPQDPADRWVVNGIRVRQPKGPPISTKPWESIGASGDGPDKASVPDADADAVAQPAASTSPSGEQAGPLASIAGAGLVTPAEELTAYLAFHLQTFAAPAQAPSDDVLRDQGVRRDTAAGSDPMPDPNLDRAQAQVQAVDASGDAVSGLDLNLDMPQSVDLDLDLDRSLSAALYSKAQPGTAVTAGAGSILPPDVEPGLRARSAVGADWVVGPAVPPMTPAPRPAASPLDGQPGAHHAAPSRLANGNRTTAGRALEIVFGSHAGRVMRSLDMLLSAPSSVPDVFDVPTDPVFVASQARQTLQALASALRRPARPWQSADDAAFDTPTDAPAEQASAAAPLPPATDDALDAAWPAVPTTTSTAAAGPHTAPAPSPLGEALVAVSEDGLDQVRGGFTTDTGLQMSFGIERGVYINGILVGPTTNITLAANGTATVSQVPGATGASASAVTNAGNLTLVQNGAGNTFLSGPVSAANAGTLIQNTLNDQTIKNLTSINATVNSLQLLRAQNFESSLRGAIVDSLRR